jgi:ubiquinone/menaquinone biosynthesis C-methylase UbiE
MKCICCQSNQIIFQPIGWREYYKCLSCDFIFTPEEVDNDSRNTVLSHYQNIDPHERVAASKQSFFNSTLSYLSSQVKIENRSILDVGCGFGYFLEFASKHGWNTYGVEIADAAVQGAKKKVGEANIFHGSLKNAYYSDECFDAITLWDVLVMVESPFEELEECFRTLKHRGKIGIRVRNVFFQKMIFQLYAPFSNVGSRFNIKNPYVFHRHNFSPKSLRLLLKRVGFRRIQITNSPLTEGDPYSHTRINKLTSVAKFLVDAASGTMFQISRGRLITGPSLLVWAEKL